MSHEMEEFEKCQKQLPKIVRPHLRMKMIDTLDKTDTQLFINRVNSCFKKGLIDGLKPVMCETRPYEFMLWLVHFYAHDTLTCNYCKYLFSVHNSLEGFFKTLIIPEYNPVHIPED